MNCSCMLVALLGKSLQVLCCLQLHMHPLEAPSIDTRCSLTEPSMPASPAAPPLALPAAAASQKVWVVMAFFRSVAAASA
jgi:hypothetical protein